MNKEVIYLEPEDDITDILTKLQGAEQKLVALVPPKKATMFRSAVNMKLVARAAKESDKVAVIVTADPAVVKQAMLAQIPVAKTLQSRPVVPTKESVAAAESEEQIINEDLSEADDAEIERLKGKKSGETAPEASSSPSDAAHAKSGDTIDLSDQDLGEAREGAKKGQKSAEKSKNGKNVPNFDKYRKWIILGAAAVILLVVFGVWAFVFAPAVKITVAMSTSASNFSEDITFTEDRAAADPASGKLFAEKQTYEQKFTSNFVATGQEDRGEKATGKVSISMTFTPKNDAETTIGLAKGYSKLTATTADGRAVTYTLEDDLTTTWDGTLPGLSKLEGWSCNSSASSGSICRKTATANVTANGAGEAYNIGAGRTWNSVSDDDETIMISNPGAFTGGTTREVTVVSQSDVDKAREGIISAHETECQNALNAQIKTDDYVIIDASYKTEAADVTPTPAVNAEVSGSTNPSLSVTLKCNVFVVAKSDIEEFVKAKTNLGSDQKIYSVSDIYVERFTAIDQAARLKAVVKTGPTVTEEDIIERSKGRKTGEVQSLLRSINGVSSVTVTPSYFWVWSVPKDTSRITVELTVEDN